VSPENADGCNLGRLLHSAMILAVSDGMDLWVIKDKPEEAVFRISTL